MPKLIGTLPYQIPTNADLGGMAYQDPAAVAVQSFSTGQISEIVNTKTSATGTVEHDFSTGAVWYHSSISANFTVNLTNVPTTANKAITVALMLNQGGTGYYPNALQVNSGAVTIRWADNITPIPGSNQIDVCVFTLVRISDTWFVVGNYSKYA